jgi:non-ribosomal peptide synthetase component E (peptide arylation enzyme)
MTVFASPSDATPDYPGTFWELVERAARERSDEVVLADDYGRALPAARLKDEAERAAAWLYGLGIRSGSSVSWQLPTTLETMVVMVALARLGAVQNPIIPILHEREVSFITQQLGTEFFLVPEVCRDFSHGDLARKLAGEGRLTVVVCDHEAEPSTLAGKLRLPSGNPNILPPAPVSDEVRWI